MLALVLVLACADVLPETEEDTGGETCVPAAEVCNGEDDDCDGEVDEEATDAATSADIAGVVEYDGEGLTTVTCTHEGCS